MAATAPVPISPAPSVPDSSLPEPTFDAQYEAFNAWEKNDLVPGANALAQNVYDNTQLAEGAAAAAEADSAQTGLDRAQTGADRVQTGLDKAATAADRVQTGQDKTATAADRVQTGQDRVQTGLDKAATAADRVQTGLDRAAAEVFATQQLKASSSTSVTPGAGNKSFTIEASRSFVPGMYLVATSSGTPADKMSGTVVSYNGTTGALVLAVDTYAGSTARADWVIGVAAQGSSSAGLTRQVVTASTTCVAGVAYIVAAAGIVLTLPTSWAAGDRIAFVDAIGNGAQYTVAFGSTPLRGRAMGTQVIDAAFGASGELTYQDATRGLV